MNDIFISYKNSDKERVKVLVEALERQGWSVWWDREIPPGKTFDQVIEEELNAARCVIVVWSKGSVLSEWVKTEASEAARRGVLVPVLIDDVKIPLEFRRIQAAGLVDWQGKLPHQGFEQLSEAIAGILGHSTILKQEQGKHLENGRENEFEKEAKQEPPTIFHEDSSGVGPKKRIVKEVQTRKKPLLIAGVAIIGLIIVAIIAYKVLFAAKFPTIDYFSASPENIEKGGRTTLNWKTSNTNEAEIIGVGKVPLSGTETVSPSETTTYTLIAGDEEGKAIKRKVTVEVKAPLPSPEIGYFKASPTRVKKGDSSTLSWDTSSAKEVEIIGVGKVSLSGDEKVSPAETTTYTIIARDERGTMVQSKVNVEVGISIPPPEILEFSAKPSTIKRGEKSTLSWETSNVKEVEINGIGAVEFSGSKTVNPTETTSYNIVARNEEDKTVEKKVTVEVRVPVTPVTLAPKIDYFVARPPSIERGSTSTLKWKTQNATKVLLGRSEVERTGSLNVRPERTTAYVLTATNAEGRKLEQTVTIEVVASARPTPRPPSRDMVQNPERYIKIPKWSFFVAGNGVAMMHHVTIENSANVAYRDVRVKVRYYSSGTQVSGTTKVLPLTVPPGSKKSYFDDGIVLGAAPSSVIDGKIEVLGAVAVE